MLTSKDETVAVTSEAAPGPVLAEAAVAPAVPAHKPLPTGLQGLATLPVAVHVLTASGAVLGLIGLDAIMRGQPGQAVVWMMLAQVLDGIDGPIARGLKIGEKAPRLDGYILDLVVDYVTCVVVPVAFLLKFVALPDGWVIATASAVTLTTALWFARTDQMTFDNWFRGFPGVWHAVVAALWAFDTPAIPSLLICWVFCVLQLTCVPFVHVLRVQRWRVVTVVSSVVSMVALSVASVQHGHAPGWAGPAFAVTCIYLLGIGGLRATLPSWKAAGL